MSAEIMKLITDWQKDPNSEFYITPEEYEKVPIKGFKDGVKRKDDLLLFSAVVNVSMAKTSLSLRPDDCFIIGYPKSGTTWVEEIVWQIQNELDFKRAKEEFHFARVVWIDRGFSKLIFDERPSPRCFKSHLPIKFLPDNFNKISKVIYVIRNPRDVLVSFYNMAKTMANDEYSGTISDMLDLFVEGKTAFGPWWEHLNQYENLENVHFIHYETLLEEPVETIRELAKYLGVVLNDEQIKSIIAFTSFDNMKGMSSFDFKVVDEVFNENLEFFKNGQIGNWKKHFTPEMIKKMDDMVKTKLKYKKPIQYEPIKK